MISRGSSSGLPKLSLYTMCNDMNFRFHTLNCSMILSYCHNGVHMVFGFLGIITTKNITCSVNLAVQSMHCEFLDYWNTQKKCLWDLTIFFICTWWRDSENMKKNWILMMAFWATCKIAQPIQPIWQHTFLFLSLPSKRHHDNSISSIFLESPHQVDIKNVVKSSKHFLLIHLDFLSIYFSTKISKLS